MLFTLINNGASTLLFLFCMYLNKLPKSHHIKCFGNILPSSDVIYESQIIKIKINVKLFNYKNAKMYFIIEFSRLTLFLFKFEFSCIIEIYI
jgi:hypothetical protein